MAAAKSMLPRVKELFDVLCKDKINTLPAYLTNINNIFKAKSPQLHEYSKTVMKQTKEQKVYRQKVSDKQVFEKHRNQVEVNYTKVIKIISDGINSSNFEDKFVALELATGSRKIEILSSKMSMFERSKTKPDWVIQHGVAKSKGQKRDIHKPLLGISYAQFEDALNAIRKHVGKDVNLSFKDLTNKYGKSIGDKVKQLFPEALKFRSRLGSHFLREIYGNVSYFAQAHEKPTSLTLWLAEVFGHEAGSLTTAASYMGVSVRLEIRSTDKEKDERIGALEEQLASINRKLQDKPEQVIQVLSTIRGGDAAFLDENDEVVTIERFTKKRKLSEIQKKEIVALGVNLLTSHSVKVTNENLRKLAIGANIVNQYRAEVMRELHPEDEE